jgi:hypothetical protein
MPQDANVALMLAGFHENRPAAEVANPEGICEALQLHRAGLRANAVLLQESNSFRLKLALETT